MAGKFDRITKDIEFLPESKKELAKTLLSKAKFMETQLTKLQAEIRKKGATEEYQNGENQRGVKKSAAVDVYNTMIKNFNMTIKQLDDMLEDVPADADALALFMRDHA